MHGVTELKWEHARLLSTLVDRCEEVASSGGTESVQALLSFLSGTFAAHARAEEHDFYPAIDALYRLHHGRPTDAMRLEHHAIHDLVNRLASLAASVDAATRAQRPAVQRMLWRTVVQLEAVARLHIEVEEKAFVPLLDHMGTGERRALLERMRAHDEKPAAAAPAVHADASST